MAQIDIFSFFTGIGFLDYGFESEGYNIKYVNEYVPSFLRSFKYAREKLGIESPEYGYHCGSAEEFASGPTKDYLSEIVEASKRKSNLVGFIAGPPCPDFSVAGKNKGKHGENGKLSATYFNMICDQNPDFFLFENVRGLWRTKVHREFFEELKRQAQAAGYVTTERLINALEYGAPQDRQRIIMIGIKKDLIHSRLPNTTTKELSVDEFPWLKYAKYSVDQVIAYPWPTTEPFEVDVIRPIPSNIPEELTVEYWFRRNNVENHPNSRHCFTPKAGLARFLTVEEGDVSRKSYKRLHRWRYSPTCAYGNNEVHLHPYKARRISVAEALSLQSLPPEFIFSDDMTLTDMFKIVGNGVPYFAARAIARSISEYIGGQSNEVDSRKFSTSSKRASTEQNLPLY